MVVGDGGSLLEEYFDDDRPQFHIQPPAGWMNDPNGPIYYKGRYHMFYQYLPDACEWDFGIIWGHAYSEDLVHWEHLPPALVPSPDWVDADGCFSGCCVLREDGSPMILYTGVRLRSNHEAGSLPPSDQDLGMVWIESQCAAVPEDEGDELLVRWKKLDIPFISLPPKGIDLTGWRDPFICDPSVITSTSMNKDGKTYYSMLIGAGIKDKGGTALVYGSYSLDKDWELLGLLCEGIADDTGVVWECPLLVPLKKIPKGLRPAARRSAPLWLSKPSSVAKKLSSADLARSTGMKKSVGRGSLSGSQSFGSGKLPGAQSLAGFESRSQSENTREIASISGGGSMERRKNPSVSLLAQKLEEVAVSQENDSGSSEAPSIASRVNSMKPDADDSDSFEFAKSQVRPIQVGRNPRSDAEDAHEQLAASYFQEDSDWYFFTVSPDAPTNPVLYWTGHMEKNSSTCPKFDIDNAKGPHRLDLGDILYAPNVCEDGHGRWVLWGWLQERRKVGSYAYAGCLTVPRILHVTDEGRLIQAPAPEIERLRRTSRAFHAQHVTVYPDSVFPIKSVKSERLDVQCSIERGSAVAAGLLFRSHEAEAEGSTAIIYDWSKNQLEAIFNVPANWKPSHISDMAAHARQRFSEDSNESCDPAAMLCTSQSLNRTGSFMQYYDSMKKDSPLSSDLLDSPFSSTDSPRGLDVHDSELHQDGMKIQPGSSLSMAMQRNVSMSNFESFGSFRQQQSVPRLYSNSLTGSRMDNFMRSTPSMLNLAGQDGGDGIEDEDLGNLLEDLAAPMRAEEQDAQQQHHEPRRVGGPLAMQQNDVLHLRIFIDHSCVEVFTGSGEVLSTRIYRGRAPDPNKPGIDFVSFGGHSIIETVSAYELDACWKNKPPTPVMRTSGEYNLASARSSLERASMRNSFRNSLDRTTLQHVEKTLQRVPTERMFEDILSPQSGIV